MSDPKQFLAFLLLFFISFSAGGWIALHPDVSTGKHIFFCLVNAVVIMPLYYIIRSK